MKETSNLLAITSYINSLAKDGFILRIAPLAMLENDPPKIPH